MVSKAMARKTFSSQLDNFLGTLPFTASYVKRSLCSNLVNLIDNTNRDRNFVLILLRSRHCLLNAGCGRNSLVVIGAVGFSGHHNDSDFHSNPSSETSSFGGVIHKIIGGNKLAVFICHRPQRSVERFFGHLAGRYAPDSRIGFSANLNLCVVLYLLLKFVPIILGHPVEVKNILGASKFFSSNSHPTPFWINSFLRIGSLDFCLDMSIFFVKFCDQINRQGHSNSSFRYSPSAYKSSFQTQHREEVYRFMRLSPLPVRFHQLDSTGNETCQTRLRVSSHQQSNVDVDGPRRGVKLCVMQSSRIHEWADIKAHNDYVSLNSSQGDT
ncbi:hypothetical protein TNCV_1215901 [Trichonephila clavipes]|nr:hypothetical protein TNCV_1215901 [Trichonephila clavipes]